MNPPGFERAGSGLIVTADDFGLHDAVNEAVALAHRDGILTAASLMVGAPCFRGAVELARRMPTLRVGLHLVLADGWAASRPERIPDLVGPDRRFGCRMVRDGFRFWLSSGVAAQVEAEIRAQFEVFASTGIPLDHVNAHKHFHLHPTVLSLLLRIGKDYGLRAMRLPIERRGPVWVRPLLWRMRRRVEAAGVGHNDSIFGFVETGRMTEAVLLRVLRNLPPGITEIYTHPATVSGAAIAPTMAAYRHADELAALVSPSVCAAARALRVPRGGYFDVANASHPPFGGRRYPDADLALSD